jgi:hypothetical protein
VRAMKKVQQMNTLDRWTQVLCKSQSSTFKEHMHEAHTWIWCSGRLSLLGMSTDSGCPGSGSLLAEICAGVGVAVTAGWRCAMAAGGLVLAKQSLSEDALMSGWTWFLTSVIG